MRVFTGTAAFEAVSGSWTVAVISYYIGGVVGGAAVGCLWFLRKSALGALTLGTVAVFPVFLSLVMGREELTGPRGVVFAPVLSLLIGGINGFLWWRSENKKTR